MTASQRAIQEIERPRALPLPPPLIEGSAPGPRQRFDSTLVLASPTILADFSRTGDSAARGHPRFDGMKWRGQASSANGCHR
jgi:hypothetical protein